MKTTDVFFKDTNFVGREIENVQDLVKAVAVGMDIANYDGVGYTSGYDDEDEDGNWVWHEKTEEERFAEMRGDLDGGCELYAGFFINNSEYSIKPSKRTTYQSNFRVGQEVYLVRNNKIVKAEILRLWLSDGNGKEFTRYTPTAVTDILREIPTPLNNTTQQHIGNVIERFSVLDGSMAYIKYIGKCSFEPLVSLADIFATKEELVKDLMKED